ncbi:hypothetical protein [Paenibacillus abyssi]|uniref:Uncharacterized protein n=1 Tax=Paenibacillus abyssi TaxID=1340531 RepID=A0A917CJF3_9BACL|nr:hypothetical protein [Paenibacillus abyssi]GGF88351.1 hypothetical protein GCM10010916_02110 [Paenibacillus abyssi]
MAEKSRELNELTVKVNVDVSEAIRGLKAVQREAKKATQALAEMQSYYETGEGRRLFTRWTQDGDEVANVRTVDVTDIPTDVLARELAKRDE